MVYWNWLLLSTLINHQPNTCAEIQQFILVFEVEY